MSMNNVVELAARLQADPNLNDSELEKLIGASDPSNAKTFNAGDGAKDAVKVISSVIIEKHLNNPDINAMPLRTKTKYLLVLNNLALQKSFRNSVLHGVKNMDGIFEESMKKEGSMPFDSELGRMSEHVLVLLMRVMHYKLKASQVHEFAENNTQFAVQLLLAILLKEPPYEFDLRVNCISGLLGFTQPQAFFQAAAPIELHTCSQFSDKVDFISNLMLRLSAVQVVNDVVAPQLLDFPAVQPQVHLAVTNMMRCVMNIFQFVSTNASQWRQHILLSTTFVDNVAVLYVQAQVRALENLLTVSQSPSLPPELLPGIGLAMKFMGFATFHMGRHARCIRPLCTFLHDLLNLQLGGCLADSKMGPQFANLYTNLLHFLANMDALGGDSGIVEDASELVPELSSATLSKSLENFLKTQVASKGSAVIETWHTKFYSVDTDALVSQDCATFQTIDSLFIELKKTAAPAPAAAAPAAAPKKSLLGEMPTLGKKELKKEMPKPNSEPVVIQQTFVAPKKQSGASQTNKFACALNGNTMKVPVTSPYGHTFEKESIEMWIKQQGAVCPLTGKPLQLTDLQVNKDLQSEIMQAVVKQTMMTRSQEDDVDLYDF